MKRQKIKVFIRNKKGNIVTRTILRQNLKNYSKIGFHNNRRLWEISDVSSIRRLRHTFKKAKHTTGRNYVIYKFPLYKRFVNEYNVDEFLGKLKQKYNKVREEYKQYIAQRIVIGVSATKEYQKKQVRNRKTGRIRTIKLLEEVGTAYHERDNLSTAEMFNDLRKTIFLMLNGTDDGYPNPYSLFLEQGYFYASYFVVQFIEDKVGDAGEEL